MKRPSKPAAKAAVVAAGPAESLKRRTPAALPPLPPPRRWPLTFALAIYLLAFAGVVAGTIAIYMWTGDELLYPVYRAARMGEAWQTGGGFAARWMAPTVYGYGWPFFTFYAPLGYIVATALHFAFGISYGAGVKISFLAALGLSGFFAGGAAYNAAREAGSRWPEQWALTCGLLFMFAPYHFTDVFVRSSLAETWAWSAMAGSIWGVEASRRRPLRGFAVVGIGVAALTLSHNISAAYGTLIIGLYTLATAPWGRGGWKWTFLIAAAGALGVGMAAWFWIPSLLLVKLVMAGKIEHFGGQPDQIMAHALFWPQFFMEQWGRGSTRIGMDDTLSLNPGVITMSGAFAATVAVGARAVSGQPRRRIIGALAVCALLMFAMCHEMPWRYVPALFRYIQFPWRLNLFLILMAMLALASASAAVERRIRPWWITLAILAAGYWMYYGVLLVPFAKASNDAEMESWYQERERTTTEYAGAVLAEYRPFEAYAQYCDPVWISENPPPENRLSPPEGALAVSDYRRIGARYHWHVVADKECTTRVEIFYFPGWDLQIDGRAAAANLSRSDEGLLQFRIPAGEHDLDLRYGEAPQAVLGDRIAAASASVFLATLAGWFALDRRKARLGAAQSPAISGP